MVPILVLGLLFALLAIGTPVGFAMAFSGSIGLLIVGGSAALFGIPRQALPRNWQAFQAYVESMLQSDELTVSSTAREMAQHLQAGTGSRLHPPNWYRALTTHLLPARLREEFQLPYGERERRTAERATRWLPRIYRRLPAGVRFVGPYLEAQAKLSGRARPGIAVRLNNRLWVGESSLLG